MRSGFRARGSATAAEGALKAAKGVLAEGVIAAVRDLNVQVPVVIRMKGNNEERGKEMLRQSGLDFKTADGMTEAAKKVVAAAAGKAQ